MKLFNIIHYRSRKRTSKVWGGIKECPDDVSMNQCRFCHMRFSNHNTSNARYHLLTCHPTQWKLINEKPSDNDSVSSESEEPAISENETASANAKSSKSTAPLVPPPGMKQVSIRKMVKRTKTAYGPKNKRRKILDEKLTAMTYIDYQPFSIVDDLGFQEFIYELDPRYPLPSRQTVARKLLPAVYDNTKMRMDAFLSKIS